MQMSGEFSRVTRSGSSTISGRSPVSLRSLNGETSTALCPDHLNIVGGAACFNDARVEIEKTGP